MVVSDEVRWVQLTCMSTFACSLYGFSKNFNSISVTVRQIYCSKTAHPDDVGFFVSSF